MSFRGRLLTTRMSRHAIGATVLGVLLSLSATSVQALPAKPEVPKPWTHDDPDPAHPGVGKSKPRPVDSAAKAAVRQLGKSALPQHGSADVAVTTGTKVRIGGLPVTVSRKAATGRAKTAASSPAKVNVEVLDRKRAAQLGAGAVLRVKPTQVSAITAKVRLAVDYAAFDNAYGGSYGARLRLVELPACAAVHDLGSRACPGAPKVLRSVNDTAARTVSADIALPAPTAATNTKSQAGSLPRAAVGATVLALQAGDSSSKGDYKATSLSPSATWSVANSSGGFSWDYPLRTVPTPGGLSPSIGLGYSSQSADGRTSATNNQGSWIGEGFSYEPGYVERSYKPCADDGHTTSAEQCWAYDNATVMLNGSASQLIKDDKSGKWRFASDNGSKIEQLTSADYATGNRDNDGEHWKITTSEGTEYYFGLNRLPGWSSGKEVTDSTWTVPVFGDDANEPCYNATFTNAHCNQAWRWNLDYVKDTHGNVMSYFYGAEKNRYALNAKVDVNGTEYDRGGYLKRIDYGQRDEAVYTTNAPARVVFHTDERCLGDADFKCDPSKFTTANAKYWPDTPVDRFCKPDVKCDASQVSQTFWTTKRLTGITTQMSTGPAATDYDDVDAWSFTHFFTDNGDDTKTLWLSKIDHEGKAGGGSAKLPSLELGGIHLINRVDSDNDNIDAIHRYRLATVLSETGSQLDVTYAPTDCTANALPKPGESAKRCYPVKWAPPGSIEPKTDWFHKYVVQEVIETDRTGGGDDLVTHYDYQGDAGWRHTEPDGITDDKYLTWGEWQGYGKVTVTSGNGQSTSTKVDYTYLQGLDGDQLPGGGKRSETVKDSTGTAYTGHKEFTGFELETQAYDKATGGKVIAKTITEPWKYDTATQTKPWGTTHATLVKPAATRGYSLQSDKSWRETKSVPHYDTSVPTARIDYTTDSGDTSTKADDTCTRLWYADNPGKNIYELPSRSETVSVDCATTPDRKSQVLADERTYYDNQSTVGAAPSKGDATKTERLSKHDGTTATYQATGWTKFDGFGRPTQQKDAAQVPTDITYTDTNGLSTQSKVTNALGHTTVTDFAPAWGQSAGQTDANGKRTDLAYDALGRLTSVWLADRAKRTNPSIKYTYNVRRDKPVAIKTEKIQNDGTYGVEYQLYDSLLRPRQKQTEGPHATRMIGEVFYDGTGKIKKTNATFNAQGAPSDELATTPNGEVGAQTVTQYDGMGRTTADIFQVAGVEQWRTTTTYNGERTHVDPPEGSVPTTTVTDARGSVTEVIQQPGPDTGPSAPSESTKYTYDPAGRLKTVTDAKDNVWSYDYDQMGRKTLSVDPDAGTTETRYDERDRPTSVTTKNGTTSTVYDDLGRPTTTWDGAPNTGTKLTETRYDKAGWLGQAYASFRYINATEYFASVTQSMDAFYQPLKTAYSVPASEGKLAGTYVFTTTYNHDSTVSGIGMPAAGGLSAESIGFGYDELQRPTTMDGKTHYATITSYSPTSQLQEMQLSTGSGKKVWQSFFYEKGTDRLTRSVVDVEGDAGQKAAVKRSNYSYDQAGNVLSISDLAGTSPDVQCFDYDNRKRLSDAWTPQAGETDATGFGTVGGQMGGKKPQACDAAPGSGALGGPAAYWKSYASDGIGNRTRDVIHDTGLDASKDVTRDYTYDRTNNAGPHAVTGITEKSPTGDRKLSYGYDTTGNTTTRTTDGNTQRLDWNHQGELTKTTEASGKETTYLYDAGGNRVLRSDAEATTVYLPGMELRLPKGGTAVEATRYYEFAGQTIAVRQDNGDLSYLASDHQGTGSLAINATTGAVAQRRFDPYGMDRGEATGTWPGEKGFVGGTKDDQSGLTHLGAREYDAGIGKFISVDPLIDYTDPQQINGYAYANNSPVSYSDSTGTSSCQDGGYACAGSGPAPGIGGGQGETQEQAAQNQATHDVQNAQARQNTARQTVKQTAKALIKIVRDIIGVDAALDCFSTGDLGACGETLLNVAGSFAGGLAGKILAKYGVPWKWAKGLKLAKRIVGLVGDLISGVKETFAASKALGKAKDVLKLAREKNKAAIAKAKKLVGKTGCHSFLPGTQVLLSDGTTKPIENIALDDKVTVTDANTGKTTTREVVGTIVTEDDKQFVDLTIKTTTDDAAALIATTTHPFWNKSKHEWTKAGDLQPGDTLRTPSGATVDVEAVRHFEKRQRTHDLTIMGIHTYYVLAGATPVLVHNSGGCPTVGLGSPSHQAIGDPNARGGVYALVSESGTVMRTGMATNLQSRLATHRRDYPGLTGVVLYRTDNRAARRGLEEMAENWYTPILANQRAIRLDNPRRQEYLQSARDFLDQWR